VFAPLEPSGRAELVTRRLSDAIALGLLHDGERLPSESELALHLGVSTVTVREALTALRQQDLVETRRGRSGGSFVRAPVDAALTMLRPRLEQLSPGDLRDLGDHYVAISGAAARLAATRASDEDLQRIRTSVEALADATGAGARRRAEGQFHIEVAASAQSARLTREEIRLQTEVGPLLWLPTGDAAAVRQARAEHETIAGHIAAGEGDAARAAAEDHVAGAMRHLTALHRRVAREARR
jgi:DNA-binding FadR family transcriptional regulator